MIPLALWTSVLALLQGPPVKPAKPLDPADGASVVEHASYNTRTQKSYETQFKARLTPPEGDSLDYNGQCVWVWPGILYTHYTASGGDEKNIVRVGDQVWLHDRLVGWVTSDEAGMPGAGRGVQNPDDVLSVLARHATGAKVRQKGIVDLTFSGEDIEEIMKEQAQSGAFDWKGSSAAIVLEADGDGRLKRFTCQATLKPNGPKAKGVVKYSAEVDATGYNGATELRLRDEKKDIVLSEDIRKAIETLKKEKR